MNNNNKNDFNNRDNLYSSYENNTVNQNNNIYEDYQNNHINNNQKNMNDSYKEKQEEPEKRGIISKIILSTFYVVAVVIGMLIITMILQNRYEFYIKEETVILSKGSNYQIKIIPKNEAIFDYLNYVYEIEDKRIAIVDKLGTVTAIGNGETRLYIRYKYGIIKKEMTIKTEKVEVNDIDIKVENEEIQRGEIYISKGETKKISSQITGREEINVSARYRSADESIARVDEYGNIEGVGIGTTVIVGEIEGEEVGEIIVHVEEEKQEIESIEFAEREIKVQKGKTAELTIIKNPRNGREEKITYKSENGNVTVDEKGKITGKKEGRAVITATSESGKQAFCVVEVVEERVEVERISINTERETIKVGKSYQIIATISPSNATIREIKWESSNPKVAIVEGGKVEGKSVGETTITARTEKGKIATCVIKVEESKIYINSIRIKENNVKIEEGTTIILTPEIEPSNATERLLSWRSSNPNVATVDRTGKVEGKQAGEAVITVVTSNGKEATTKVEVTKENILPTGIRLDKTNGIINKNETIELTATISPSNATNRNITWESGNTRVATVTNGKVYGVGGGKATITAKTSNGKTATFQVQVNVPVTSIMITTQGTTIKVNGEITLGTTISPSDATDKNITWSSSNTNIATVDGSGKVKGKSVGEVTITAKTSNNKKATKTIKVEKNEIQPTKVNINPTSLNIQIAGTASIVATVEPSNATNQKVTWTSNKTSVATVDSNGKVKGVSVGTATITAKTSNGKVATCKITVKSNNVSATGITLNIKNTTVNKGDTLLLIPTITPSNTTNKKVTWTSSKTNVATVDESGLVTAKAAGTTTITAKTSNGKVATCKITVSIPIRSVKIDKTEVTLKINKTSQLKATISPNDTTMSTNISWTSSKTSVATVDESGLVTAKQAGTTTITATTSNGKKATATIVVNGSRIHFLKLPGGGDSIILESNGKFALVDAGNSDKDSMNTVLNYINKLGIKEFEFIIISHAHTDHEGYLAPMIKNDKIKTKTIYLKKQLDQKADNYESDNRRHQNIINYATEKGINQVYIDNSKSFKEDTSTYGKVSLGLMEIDFYNTIFRNDNKNSGTFDYFTSNNFQGQGENTNSIVNLVKVNGHNVLLTGDLNEKNIWKGIYNYRLKNIHLDVLKLAHHGFHNCVGDGYSSLGEIKADYYVATTTLNANAIQPDKTEYTPGVIINSCFHYLATETSKRKEIMCNTYYTRDSSDDAVIVDLSKLSTVTVTGGGYETNKKNSKCQ